MGWFRIVSPDVWISRLITRGDFKIGKARYGIYLRYGTGFNKCRSVGAIVVILVGDLGVREVGGSVDQKFGRWLGTIEGKDRRSCCCGTLTVDT